MIGITALNYTATGGIEVFRTGWVQSGLSNVQFKQSESPYATSATAVVRPDENGQLTVVNHSTGTVDVRVNVQGWFSFPDDDPETDGGPEDSVHEDWSDDLPTPVPGSPVGMDFRTDSDTVTSFPRLVGTVPIPGGSPDAAIAPSPEVASSLSPDASTIDSQTWAACGAFDDKSKLVRYFGKRFKIPHAGMNGSFARLRCGLDYSSTDHPWGYRHIAEGHTDDRQAKADYLGLNWRNFADWAIEGTLAHPVRVTYRVSRGTFTYNEKVRIYEKADDGTETVLSRFWVQVVLGDSANRIITAFPSHSKSSGDIVWTEADGLPG
jgi:hypothetical protein